MIYRVKIEEKLRCITSSYLTRGRYQIWLDVLKVESGEYSINFGYRIKDQVTVNEAEFIITDKDHCTISVVLDNQILLQKPINPDNLSKDQIGEIIIEALDGKSVIS